VCDRRKTRSSRVTRSVHPARVARAAGRIEGSGVYRGTAPCLDTMNFIQRLAALAPRPRLRLIRFHGAFAPTPSCVSRSFPACRSTPIPPQRTSAQRLNRSESGYAPVQNEKARRLPPRPGADISASAHMSAELLRHRLVSPANTHAGQSVKPCSVSATWLISARLEPGWNEGCRWRRHRPSQHTAYFPAGERAKHP
jgi:hypothetical protein